MSNPAILRPQVHRLSEECSADQEGFKSTATRLIKNQRRLSRFIEQSFAGLELEPQVGFVTAQVSVYMLSVSLRVFDKLGGRLRKVTTDDINAATARIQAVTDQVLPADDGLPARTRAIEWRAQPHLLDEILWALFERNSKKEEEVDLPSDISALVFMTLWVSIEALDANWTPPKGWSPDDGLLEGEDPEAFTPPS
jgi:hypothetical protein